jgi:hypothetical protein
MVGGGVGVGVGLGVEGLRASGWHPIPDAGPNGSFEARPAKAGRGVPAPPPRPPGAAAHLERERHRAQRAQPAQRSGDGAGVDQVAAHQHPGGFRGVLQGGGGRK